MSNNANIGPAPLVAPGFGCLPFTPPTTGPDCVVSLLDRDVILVNADTDGLSASNPMSDDFTAQATVRLPGAPEPLSFDRGWASIDATFDDARFRFVNTHLEVEDFAEVQEAQASELLAGPMRPGGVVIAVGDFNSAAPGSTQTTRSYRILIKGSFLDAWWTNPGQRGFTCCQNSTLTNLDSELSSRIDLVLTRSALPTEAHLVGDKPFQNTAPLWPSDHAGVVADVLVF